MTDVLVCVKRVPDSTSEVVLTEDGQSVDGRFAGFTMSAHEECAVELAAQVTAADGGEATVLTIGDAYAVEQLLLKFALSTAYDWRQNHHPFAFRQRFQVPDNLIRCLF